MLKKIFVDSDVIISSLISSSGASYFLLNQTSNLKFYISNISYKELVEVVDRLKIAQDKLKNLLKYSEYTTDPDDTHIVAGAKKAKVNFLISYNTKHFKIDKIKQDFNTVVMTPAIFLQYLRSID